MFSINIEEYKCVLGAPNSASLVAILASSVFQKNIDSALFIVEAIFKDENYKFEHPTNREILTYARGQAKRGMWNAVVFSDENRENAWLLIQSTSFVDFIITESNLFYVGKNKSSYIDIQLSKLISTINERALWNGDIKKIAFEIGQTTPYHFFYDQLKYLRYICSSKKVFANGNSIFFSPEAVGVELSQEKPLNVVSFFPSIVTQNSCNALGYGGGDMSQKVRKPTKLQNNDVVAARVREIMEDMETSLLNYALKGDISNTDSAIDNGAVSIWIGITSSKRSWLQQIEGYTNIVKALASDYHKVNVFVDGVTSAINVVSPKSKDTDVYKLLASNLVSCTNINLVSLIGTNYESKIKVCNSVDAFIANGGTGSFVPLRVLRKPGVIHTNTKLMTFPDEYANVSVLIGEDDHSTNDQDPAGTMSYRLDWREILQALQSCLDKKGND